MSKFSHGKTVGELVRIAHEGGGFELSAPGRTTDEIVRVAAAASLSGAQIRISSVRGRTVDKLVRIAFAGKGSVDFYDD